MESDSKVSPFLRGFRRENSDLLPLGSRHSAIFLDRTRSSGIFNNRRSSDAGFNATKNTGEPVLMDYVKRTESPSSTKSDTSKNASSKNRDRHLEGLIKIEDMFKPRREKTESDIVLRNSDARKSIRESLEARRRETELDKKRVSRNTNSDLLSSTTNSFSGDEYLFIQVIVP